MGLSQMKKNKKWFNGFIYKFREKDFKFFCILLVLGSFLIFVRGSGAELNLREHSFFELYLWSMGDAVNIVFIHTIAFLVFVSKVFLYGAEDMIAILHQDSKRKMWGTNVCSAFMFTLLYLFGTGIATMLMSINKNMFVVTETEFLREQFNELFHIADSDSKMILIGTVGNGMAYFFCIALICYILLSLSNKKSIALIGTLVILFFNYIIFLCKIHTVERYTLLGNILLCYGYGRKNAGIHTLYWVFILGMICLLSYWITRQSDIIKCKTNRQNQSIYRALRGTIGYWGRETLSFGIMVAVLYFCLSYQYIGDHKAGFKAALTACYAGSDRIDVRFLLWLFLELSITLFVTNKIYQLINYNTSVRILHLKNKKRYATYLSYVLLTQMLCVFIIILVVVGLCLKIRNGTFNIGNQNGGNLELTLLNTWMGMVAFCYFVGLFNFYIKNFAQSYFIIFVVQQLNMVLYRSFGKFYCFLPLLHGCTGLYQHDLNLYVVFLYQMIEVFVLQILFRRQLLKSIDSV